MAREMTMLDLMEKGVVFFTPQEVFEHRLEKEFEQAKRRPIPLTENFFDFIERKAINEF